jgi:hypothetical protein
VDQRKAEDRRGNRPEIATDIPAGTTATASNPGFAIDAATIYKSDLNTTSAIGHDRRGTDAKMSEKYPKYYKDIPAGVDSLDIYAVCLMFNVNDAALSHALKKIMLPGVRTGNKTRRDDIKEARDTLNRWLELHK